MANRASKKEIKKEARKMVYDRLATALADLRQGIKDKKFEAKLDKASKLIAADIAKLKWSERTKKEKVVKADQQKDLQLAG